MRTRAELTFERAANGFVVCVGERFSSDDATIHIAKNEKELVAVLRTIAKSLCSQESQ